MKLRYIQPGIASLSSIMARRLAFADKTHYLEILERPDSPDVPVFLRPRRFGKTLFTDILFNYYDKSKAADFDKNFKGTWIYSHPTENKNSYYCVRLDFSSVTSNISGIAGGLISELCGAFKDFTDRYPDKGLPGDFFEKDPGDDPAIVINKFISNFRSHSKSGEWLYFIIDEYDHFINEVLSKDREAFRDLTSTEEGHSGLVKLFYTCL
ncbi:MAG: AAA family ATPase, partial [Succinivibrio sp.]|nr:AAA family ATPase [Succinivibrio sp.]